MPSGNPGTSVLNSLCNLVLIVLAFYNFFDPGVVFWNFVHPIVFGDDNVIGVSSAVSDRFNQHTIPGALARYGAIYTPENKDVVSTIASTRPITEVTFLKRGFRFETQEDKWDCPLDLDIVLTTPYYTRDKDNFDDTVRAMVEDLLVELSMHSQSRWDTYGPIVKKACEEIQYTPRFDLVREDYRLLLPQHSEKGFW
jgi:hypothetical protein